MNAQNGRESVIAHADSRSAEALGLLPQHWQTLKDSGISDEAIAARAYRSITTQAELGRLGFAGTQRNVPTLLIPIYNVHGEVRLLHHRPDQPRCDPKRGRIIKYEFPAGSQMVIDVHPFITQKIRDPTVPLFITEGVKKADSAVSRGLCCIALVGTWNWRGTNEYGGKTALPDWDSIAIKDRDIYIAFDSDVMEKPSVNQALSRLQGFLKSRGAR